MLPAMSVTSRLPGYADDYFEPFWSACEEHGMVVNLHTGASGSATDTKFLYDAEHGGMLGLYEVFVFTRRPLWFMIFGGVFDRHPDLKVVVTENGVQWLPSLIRDMESFFDTHGGAPVRSYLEMRPRDYFEKHVWLGGSLMKRYEAEMRHEIGIDKLMWGADYPHLEGAAPVHRETLRYIFGGLPEDDLRRILGANAVDLWGFDADLLQSVADRVGPTVADLAEPLALGDIEDTFSWSLARPVPLATADLRSGLPGNVFLLRGRPPRPTVDRPPKERSPPKKSRTMSGKILEISRRQCVTPAACIDPWSWTNFAEALEALVASGPDTTATARPSRRCTGTVTPRVLRHRGHGGLRGGRGVGGGGGQDGAGVDRHALSGPPGRARRRVRLGRALRHLPECAEAWREGASARTRPGPSPRRGATAPRPPWPVTRRCSSPRPPSMGFEDFYRALRYWKQLADPDGADAADEERKASRHVFLEPASRDVAGPDDPRPRLGLHRGRRAQPPRARALRGRLCRGQGAPRQKARLDELARTSGQRRADALVEMATRSAQRAGRGHPPRPALLVFVGYETLHGRICELENGTVLAPSALTPWMDSAYFERAVFSLGNRVDVSVRARLFSGGTRRAIELRDRMCTHPLLLRAGRELPGRPHRALGRGRPDHPGERPPALRLPQPPAQPTRTPSPSASAPRRPRREGAAPSARPAPASPRLILAGTLKANTHGASASRVSAHYERQPFEMSDHRTRSAGNC